MQSCQKNNIIAVCAGTKGVGVTWFALTLGQTLALRHRKVLFFDASGGAENIAAVLGLKDFGAYEDMLKGSLTMNLAAKAYNKGHFDVIYANPKDGKLSAYPIGRAQILTLDLKNFAGVYDDVLVDCGDDNPALKNMMIAAASKIVLVTTPSKFDLTGAYHELESVKKIAPDTEVWVVINRAPSLSEGERTFERLVDAAQKFMSFKVNLLGIICQDGRIRDCTFNKTTLFERYPTSESLQSLSVMADVLQKGEKQ